jgi:prevent-host-death family protein
MLKYISQYVFFVQGKMMQKVIGVTELQRRFRAVFDEVVKQQVPYVLTRGSRPEAVLIPYEEFLHWQALQEQEVLARFDQLMARMADQNAAVDEEEVAADVAAARAELAG